jgi:S-adenosylmethionine synthetase
MITIQVERSFMPGLIEIVERKGLGHPDTICDHISEEMSLALSRQYLDRCGHILHHNVDKVLLSSGQTEPRFGGGVLTRPLELYLAGHATHAFRAENFPIADLANDVARAWFRKNLHAFDIERGLRVHCLTKPGSSELVDLFARDRSRGRLLANDTSVGTGYAPLSPLEKAVLAIEQQLNAPAFKSLHPETGEDIKVMAVRQGDDTSLTIACALVDRHLPNVHAYADALEQIRATAMQIARERVDGKISVRVNAADDIARGSVYITVQGTSAECGDDGVTGRGNRANGLITPFRPMTLEAMAGKNPVTHVGKLYNAAATRIAERVVTIDEIESATCYLVSTIGVPIDEPATAHLRVASADGRLQPSAEIRAREIMVDEINGIPDLWTAFLAKDVSYA